MHALSRIRVGDATFERGDELPEDALSATDLEELLAHGSIGELSYPQLMWVKYTLRCPQFGWLTHRILAGERVTVSTGPNVLSEIPDEIKNAEHGQILADQCIGATK